MATYYFRNTGDVRWGLASNWSLTDGGGATGAVPTLADNAYFTSNSGNCTQNAGTTQSCKDLIFSGVGAGNYARTFTFNQSLSVNGNITLSATMTIATTGGFITVVAGGGTFTSNGKALGTTLDLSGTSQTYTLADDWQVTNFTVGASGSCTLNGLFNLKISGNCLQTHTTPLLGTVTLLLNGTGLFGSAQAPRVNVTINTAGTITFSATSTFGSATFKYIAGTIVNTGSTFTFGIAGTTTTIDTSGMNFNNVIFAGATGTIALLSDMNITGTAQFGNGSGALTATGAFTFYCSGSSVVCGSTGSFTSTTTKIEMTGNCVLTSSGQFAMLDMRINCGTNTFTHTQNGTILGSPTVTGTLTFVSGKLNIGVNSNILIIGNFTFDTGPVQWNQIDFSNSDQGSGTRTLTLNSQLLVKGLIRLGGFSTTGNTWNETFAGNYGFTCGSLIIDCSNTGRNISFAAGIAYYIKNLFTCSVSFSTANTNLKSSSSGVKSRIVLDPNCSILLYGVNITDLDNASGFPINIHPNGITISTISNAAGWNVIPLNSKVPFITTALSGLNLGLKTGLENGTF